MSQSVERAYISVVTSAPQQVPAYLYSTAEVVLTMQGVPGVARDYTGVLVAVEALPGTATGVAQYQADRLSSGLHGAKVHDTFQDAQAHLSSRLVAGKHTATGYLPPETLTAARQAYISPARQQVLRGR